MSGNVVKIHIAAQLVSLTTVDSYIDHNCTLFDISVVNKLRLADRNNQDIRLFADLLLVLRV